LPIICFFGPDGSGKTSLARELASTLSKKGCRVRISWMRGTHTLAFILSRVLREFDTFKRCNSRMISIPTKMALAWRFIELISLMPVLLVRFIIPNLLGFWIVGERYIPDFVVWVAIIINDDNYMSRPESKILLCLARKTAVNIYVTADVNKLNERSSEDTSFLTSQQRFYRILAETLKAYEVNTTHRSVERSFQEVDSFIRLKQKI